MQFLSVAGAWAVAALLLFFSWLPGTWRRAIALLASAAGVVFLVLAVQTEGVRESPTLSVFLLGTPYVTQQASASASLPYYTLTAVCLLLGTLGLAIPDGAAKALRRHWMATAILVSIGVTLLRFALEKVAAPYSWIYPVGVVWLVPVVAVYFALCLRASARGFGSLLASLLVYALAVRGFVVVLLVIATHFRLGSHYDVSPVLHVRFEPLVAARTFEPGSLAQVIQLGLIPQLVFWPLLTLVWGGLVGGLSLVLARLNEASGAGSAAR